MDVVNGWDDNGVFGDLVASGEDEICLCCATRLERRVVSSLCLLDVLVEEGQLLSDVGCELCVLVDAVVDEFLEEAFLHSGVCDKAVNQPREQRASGCETSTGGNYESFHKTGLRKLLSLAVDGSYSVV